MTTPAIVALATSPDWSLPRIAPALVSAPVAARRPSQGRGDSVAPGQPAHMPGKGWGVTTAARREMDRATEEWVLRYQIVPPTEAQVPAVLAAMRARLIADAERQAGAPCDDERAAGQHQERAARLRALIDAVRAEG